MLLNITRTRRLTKNGPQGGECYSSWSPITLGGYNTPLAFGVLTCEKTIAGKSFKDQITTAFGNPEFFSCWPVRKTLYICRDILLPNYVNLRDNREEFSKYLYFPPSYILKSLKYKEYLNGLKIYIQLPDGCRLADEQEVGNNGVFSIHKQTGNVYEFSPILSSRFGRSIKNFISFPLFIKSSANIGNLGEMLIWTQSTINGKTCTTAKKSFPVKVINFPVTPQLKKFVISMWPTSSIFYWPNYVDSLKKSGFNSFDCRIPWYTGSNDKIKTMAQRLLSQAKSARLKISIHDSTFYRFKNSQDGRWGNTTYPDPTYRGSGYLKDINAVKEAVKIIQPDYLFIDCEVFTPVMENKDVIYSNKEFIKKQTASGLTLPQYLTKIGDEIAKDIKKALAVGSGRSGDNRIRFGFYGTGMYLSWEYFRFPGNEFFEGIYNINSLIKNNLTDFAMPDTYHDGNMEHLLGIIEPIVLKVKTNKILPWESAGYHSGMSVELVRDQFLETIAFGCRGVAYWRPEAWDVGAYLYQAYAIQEVAPFEDIFFEGKPFSQTKFKSDYHVKGVSLNDNEAIILVSRYKNLGKITVNVNNPLSSKVEVWDRSENKLLGNVMVGATIKVTIDKRNTKLLYLGNNYKARISATPGNNL